MSAATAKPDLPSEEKAIADSITTFVKQSRVASSRPGRLKIVVPRENLMEAARYAKELRFDHAENVTGTDFPKEKELEITYHLSSIDGPTPRKFVLALTCRVPTNDPVLPSLIEIFPSVNYHERESAEMLGFVFQGHPNLTRFLLPEDWDDIPPLLKAYRLPGRLEGE